MNLYPRSKQLLGNKGESIATSYLIKKGYVLVQRNFKARYGEIDIILTKDNTLIFVEVKTRIGELFGKPEESVTPGKLREVIKTAGYYKLLHTELPEAMRIDVIGIELDADEHMVYFNHIQNVTM